MRVEVVKAADPLVSVAVPSVLDPSVKVIVPVGGIAPPVRVAVRVTAAPTGTGLADAAKLTVGTPLLIVNMTAEEVDGE